MNRFKNLKVRSKILLAFGAVLGLMCIATIFIVLANLKILENVDVISEDLSFQYELSETLEMYNAANVQAAILYEVIDEEARDTFRQYATQTEQGFQKVLASANAHQQLQKLRPTIQNASDKFAEWNAAVNEMLQRDVALEEGRQVFSASGSELVEGVGSFMSYQVNNNVAKGQLTLANQINDHITAFRLLSRTFQYTFDSSYVGQIKDKMDETIALLEQYRSAASTAGEAQAAQRLIDIIQKRYAYTDAFSAANDASDAAQEQARPLGLATAEALDIAAQDVYDAIEERAANTKSTAFFSFIVVLVAVVAVLLSAVFVAIGIAKSITRPLAKMQAVMEQTGKTGNLSFSEEARADILKEAAVKDEIGQSIAAFAYFVGHMLYVSECLTTMAGNDLSLEVRPIGPEDTMGVALETLAENMNAAFRNIAMAADQVSTGSEQVSDTSIALSQGATEQASSVQQLSASMEEISAQTEQNADNANRANDLAGTAKTNAELGDRQMQEMVQAMQEISDASASIFKVIKVIDDIAFQTNILALNAAVEAARAGEAGKGFAVVAEEVRNLAARSADAARETTQMIEGSIQKTENGTQIAAETAHALKLIVEGIEQTADLVQNIAAASAQQATGIAQVNQGIMQVSHVVQTNAATSEESAAASEEMSGQAQLLKEMIARFKLQEKERYQNNAGIQEHHADFIHSDMYQ